MSIPGLSGFYHEWVILTRLIDFNIQALFFVFIKLIINKYHWEIKMKYIITQLTYIVMIWYIFWHKHMFGFLEQESLKGLELSLARYFSYGSAVSLDCISDVLMIFGRVQKKSCCMYLSVQPQEISFFVWFAE